MRVAPPRERRPRPRPRPLPVPAHVHAPARVPAPSLPYPRDLQPTPSLPIHHPRSAPSPARISPLSSSPLASCSCSPAPHAICRRRRVCALRWQVHAWRLAQQGLDGRHHGEPRHPSRLLFGGASAWLESLGACARLGGAGRPYPTRPHCAHALRDGALSRAALPPELGPLPPRTLAHQPLTS